MKIHDAIKLLDDEKNILICDEGHRYQKYNSYLIMCTYNKDTLKGSTVASSINVEEFLKKHIDKEFERELQWFQKGDLKLPRLCHVDKSDWGDPKIVMINYFSGAMFNTGYGESYIPTYHTKITPLSNDEIENLKRE